MVEPHIPVSPIEIAKVLLEAEVDRDLVPAGVVVGPLTNDQQQRGGVSLTDAGNTRVDAYAPVIWGRVQVRCLARTMDEVDRIAYHVRALMHWPDRGKRREVVGLSSGNSYLVHSVNVTAGPSTHYDSQVTWESLMFLQVMVGTEPAVTND